MADKLYLQWFKIPADCILLGEFDLTNSSFDANVGGRDTLPMFDKYLIKIK